MRIAELFTSIHGEVNGHHQGRVVTFIRLSGCNLKCSYCDTAKTQDPEYGRDIPIAEILNMVDLQSLPYVCLTGGEPLLNPETVDLLACLYEKGYRTSVETNGTISINPFFRYVESFVIDYKMEYENLMLRSNYVNLRESDVIKFVVKNQQEIDRAMELAEHFQKEGCKAIMAFSPVNLNLHNKEITQLLIYSLLDKRLANSVLSLQIHKILKIS